MPTQPHIIDFLVDRIFKYTSLRQAVTDEVHFYDMIEKSLKDTNPGSAFWNDGDGWRSWTYSKERNKYYFNDIPEYSLGDAINYTLESKGPEFDLDEVW
jgi:hypothetical protein